MTIGGSIFLIAVGAILYFATNLHVKHVSIDAVGLILMIAGLAGLVFGLIQQSMWSRRSRRDVLLEERRGPRRDVVVEERRDPRDPPVY
jgi:predicted MFS family arabinose efflux permease